MTSPGAGLHAPDLKETSAPATLFANAPESLGVASGTGLPVSLEQEIRAIYRRSPLYPQCFPLHAEPLRWSCYREIPVLTKQDMVRHGHEAFSPITLKSSAASR